MADTPKPRLADVLKESVTHMKAIERGEASPLPVRYPSPDFDPAASEFVFETDDDDAAYEDDPWIEAAERRGFEKAKRAALEAVKQRHRSCSGYYDMDYGNAMRAAIEEIEGIAFDGAEAKPADERAALMAAMGGPAWFGGQS